MKHGRTYWYAYRRSSHRLRKVYLGRLEDLTPCRLATAAEQLASDEPAVTRASTRAIAPASPTAQAALARLPSALTPLIGRERLVPGIARRLLDPSVRLLTLTGPGGTGKTRVAIAVARQVASAFDGNVWFVDLSAIVDPDLVVREIAQHVGIRDASERPVTDRLLEHLADARALLVLDNFEQVLPAAEHIGMLLERCSHLQLLVTSRASLHLQVEVQHELPPLGLPERRRHMDREYLERTPAISLFLQRADAAGAHLETSERNVQAIADLCRRLDGLPLAIELAAARSKLLPPLAMLPRLERQLELLRTSAPDRRARHRSVYAAVAWSYELLDPDEQRAFRSIAAFAGGCSIDAVEVVCVDVDLDTVASLVDKSLLRSDAAPGGDVRLRMLETIRAYAWEQLVASGEADAVRRRHAEYYAALLEAPEGSLHEPATPQRLDLLAAEHDNVRAALRWALDTDTDLALRLALAAQALWVFRGFLREGLGWLDEVLLRARGAQPEHAAWLSYAAGQLAWRQGDVVRAARHYEKAVALNRSVGNELHLAQTLQGLAAVERDSGHTARAVELYTESLSVFRAANDAPRIVRCLLNLAIALHLSGRSEEAAGMLDETATLARPQGQTWALANALIYRAVVSLDSARDVAGAAERLLQALAMFDDVQDEWVTNLCLEVSAWLALESKRTFAAGLQLLATSHAQRSRMGARLPTAIQSGHARVAHHLSPGGNHAVALPFEEAMNLAAKTLRMLTSSQDPTGLGPPVDVLSTREREIAKLVARGMTSREIAVELGLSERTVDTHVDRIRAKLGVRSRVQITSWVHARGLLG